MKKLSFKQIKNIMLAVLAALFVTCIGLAFKIMPTAYAAVNPEMTVQVSQESAMAGETVRVTISLKDNPGVASIKLNVAYENFLTLQNIEYNSSLGGQTSSSNYQIDGSPATLIWVNAFENFTQNEVFATLTFKIADDTESDSFSEITVTYNPADIYNAEETDINLTVINGSVYVQSCKAGDINGDGSVNNKDITRLFQYLANWNVTVNEDALDVNGDGSVNNKDITRLFQYLANWDVKVYVRKPCIVTFNGNGGTLVSGKESQAVRRGGSAVAPVYEKEGFSFDGFDVDYTNITRDLIVTAKWKENDKKLETPVISTIEYDTIYWSPVDNADYYTVRVNDNYECTLRGTSCSLSAVKWNGNAISDYGYVSVKIMANQNGDYLSSDWSAVDSSYFYVPENHTKAYINTAKEYGVSFGYNFIEDANLSAANIKNTNSILNIYKIATVTQEINRNRISRSTTGGYYYSSIDDFMAKMSFDLKYGLNNSLSLPFSGDLKTELELAFGVSSTLKTHKYSSTYIGQIEAEGYSYSFNQLDLADLKYCLSDTFKKEIGRNTDATRNLTDEELCDYIYRNYGTHIILGVKTGGLLITQYNVCTNSEQIATDVNFAFALSFGSGIQNLVSTNFNFDLSLQEQIENKTEQTQTSFHTYSRGGTKAFTTKLTDYSATSQSWTVDDSNAEAIGVTENGALAISSLLYLIDTRLGAAFEAYINGKADEAYHNLFDQYTMPTTLPMSVNMENGQNVLRVDLSSYQSAGTLGDAYSPNLLNNVLTVYPVMFGKDIDKIVVIGAFDENRTLIDSFSLALSPQWKRPVDIEFENCGFVCALENGLVDDSKVSFNANILYKGVNCIKDKQGNTVLCAKINDQAYDFVFLPTEGATIDLSTIRISSGELTLAYIEKGNYTFMGWKDSNNVFVTDKYGKILNSYVLADNTVNLHADFTPVIYEITLNSQSADNAGTTKVYERFGDNLYFDENCENEIEYIVVPQKTGYDFKGYYLNVENNATTNARGTGKYIDEYGNFVGFNNTTFTAKTTLYALWQPATFTITLDNGDGVENSVITSTYKVGVSTENVSVPEKAGYIFRGYYVSVTDNNTEQAVGATKVINENGKVLFNNTFVIENNTVFYALWLKIELTFALNTDHTEYTVTGYNGTATEVYIPAEYEGLPVTAIGDNAFKNKAEITNIEIPDSVTRIGDGAFSGCSCLRYNAYDNGYYLGNNNNPYLVFVKAKSTDITSCEINDLSKVIYSLAFNECALLNYIDIGNGIKYIGFKAFYGCNSLTEVFIPKSVAEIADGSTIWNYVGCFSGCNNLQSVIIEENSSLRKISNSAFAGCNSLKSIVIPNTLSYIGDYAFYNCSQLEIVSIPSSVLEVGRYAFNNCVSINCLTIPKCIVSVGTGAFTGCSGLTRITYEGNVEQWLNISFGSRYANPLYYAHSLYINNELLTNIVIPSTVQSIKAYSFTGCESLITITIPSAVKFIGVNAFLYCTNLAAVNYEGTISDWCNIVFNYSDNSYEVSIYSNPLFYAGNLYINNELVTNLEIPDSVKEVYAYSFLGCTCIKTITFSSSIEKIGNGAFYECNNIETITIPLNNSEYTLTSIFGLRGSSDYVNIDSIKSVIILTGIEITSNTFKIFESKNLENIRIPNTITVINENAFYWCRESLKNIIYEGTIEQWAAISQNLRWQACNVICSDGKCDIKGRIE